MYIEPESFPHLPPQTSDSLQNYPALILNADYRPLSYFPLSIWSWQDAIKAVFRDAVTVVSEYDRFVSSPSIDVKLPSVLALKDYVPQSEHPAFTRFNVFLRDEFQCQYCGDDFKTHQLTFDHVIPRSKGGKTSWENIVASCRTCNTLKGSKLPKHCGMYPRQTPREPTIYDLQRNGQKFPPNFLHESWGDFLYWDTELDRD
jgi:5-methylcytosine-specific restriction endonuclease McrA